MEMSERGKAYAIYLHVPLPPKPKNLAEHLRRGVAARLTLELPAGSYDAFWLDTKNGARSKFSVDNHAGGPLTISTPTFDNDIALRIAAR
jgi:hypothetical protein